MKSARSVPGAVPGAHKESQFLCRDVPFQAAPRGARTPLFPIQEVLVGIPGLGAI